MRSAEPRRPSRLFVWVERVVLGVGMTFMAALIDGVLRRMLRKGPVEAAPRTAAGPDGVASAPSEEDASAELTPPAKEVADQPGG